jgi:NADPH-dependent glutamate synthase beta subunit-like oxidoreductase/NAD(P)H-flavin reductase
MAQMAAPDSRESARWNFRLGFPGFRFADLNRVRRLAALDQVFRDQLRVADPTLCDKYEAYRAASGEGYASLAASQIIIDVAIHLGPFIARLFHIQPDYEALRARTLDENRVFDWKKRVLDKRVLRPTPKAEEIAGWDVVAFEAAYREVVARRIKQRFVDDPEKELAEVGLVSEAAKDEATDGDLTAIVRWARALAFHPDVKKRAAHFSSFAMPETTEYENLVHLQADPSLRGRFFGPEETRRRRDGFKLTDERMKPREVLEEVHYCLYCHDRDKDSCSKGYRKQGEVQKNPLGIELNGCPLDEKISEMHVLKRDGHVIGALATAMIDNPMCAGTGHRICNDCMKGCIFQKQTPVNIPQIETGILTEVLKLPYGFEIYALLTRWNPLNARRPVPLAYNGKNVLVVGMGPAGYTLAHHLLNEGFGVVGIDGLRIEPLPTWLRGAKRRVPKPIRDLGEITGPLDERTIKGFGGVSEYGITVRWDKNFLDIIYLLMMRRKKFRLYDGIRFGGTLTIEDAWRLGFDHIAIASGAGKPTLLSVKNNMLRGMRQASDFLMGLQASGAYKRNSLVNVQVNLPAVVVGGGLTAIDTATELIAYYVVQVEKTLERYERLLPRIGETAIWARFDDEERETLTRWLDHGRAVREERTAARLEKRAPDFARLAREWGGVTIAYRRRLQDSPAYRLNHEEVEKALEEGIGFAELLNPVECVPNRWGALESVKLERQANVDGKLKGTGEMVEIPARSMMVAAGTHPNVIYEREYPGTFKLDKWGEFFLPHRVVDGKTVPAAEGEVGFFTSYEKDGRFISYYGDNHPQYAGNVVKAMASAKNGYPEVAKLFATEVAALEPEEQSDRELDWVRLAARLDDQLISTVVDAHRLTKTIVEVVVRAPLAAKHFHPGQFYRLQNYDSLAESVAGFNLTMEGIALTGAWVDKEQGLVSLIALEMGGSSRMCALLQPGEEVVLMGPTGTPTEIPENETVLLAGGGLGNAVLFSIAEALKAKGNRVLYFGAYKKKEDLYKRKEIERGADVIIWSVDQGELIEPRRPQDRSFLGNIVQAMNAYGKGELGPAPIPLHDVQRVISIGSDRMMDAVRVARKNVLHDMLPADHHAIGSINSPMQCMMKEICAQCLQRHVDPATQKESMVFSCFNQDQPLDAVDFEHLRARLRQNSVAEKLTSLWIDHLFEAREVEAV